MFQITQRILFISSICLILQACGGDDESKNTLPTVSVQAPDLVDEHASVNLTAAASDSDGTISAYQWQQISGTNVEIIGNDNAQATFIAPEITADESLVFSVKVTDNKGGHISKDVAVLVQNVNQLPVLAIQAPDSVNEMSMLTLIADNSDSDGTIVSYQWQQIAGTALELGDTEQATLSVLLPNIRANENISFSLTVTDNDGGQTTEQISISVTAFTLSQTTNISAQNITENDTNSSIFISALDINIDYTTLASVAFTVQPRSGSVAAPLKATYAIDKLTKLDQGIHLPIYGMYRSHSNDIELTFSFIDGSTKTIHTNVITGDILEPSDSPFNHYQITEPLAGSVKPSYDYLLMKSSSHGPVIMDIDGNVRWQAYLADGASYSGRSTVFKNGSFTLAAANKLYSLHLDGSYSEYEISLDGYTDVAVHHELSKGKTGYLVEINAVNASSNTPIVESILIEVDDNGQVQKQWDFGEILIDYMIRNGDDPTNFVREGIDWFHMNSAIYDANDNSLIVSSRENFVIKIDYDSKEIKWLLGDETKHWYVNFPSLRSLSLSSVDTKPIGQHALSMVNGELLLFNDGQLSFNQPEDAPKGLALTTSPSARYAIDEEAMMANITWVYDAGIYSDVCSSIYQDESSTNGDYLVNFSSVNRTNDDPIKTIIQGVSAAKELLFEFEFETTRPCFAAWNSSIVYGLTDLQMN